MNRKIKLEVEVEVNDALENALISTLEAAANGMMREDAKEYQRLAEEARRVPPDAWSEELKYELASYITLRAGFQFWDGREASMWEA